ncbi:MAG: DUF6514 family protein [Clostridia bacterium]|nr:DUF6514 family protein [Clostridia bacterium]
MSKYPGPYEIVERQCFCEEVAYTAYGIRLKSDTYCRTIDDISTDKKAVAGLVERLNENCLDGCQFLDAVEDFLAGC